MASPQKNLSISPGIQAGRRSRSQQLVLRVRKLKIIENPMGFSGWQHMSHEKSPGWLGYIGDYTTQLYGDYNKPL